jgi:hypothetical protein
MPLMKKSHSGNENHTPPLVALGLTPAFHFPNALNDLHGHRIYGGDGRSPLRQFDPYFI